MHCLENYLSGSEYSFYDVLLCKNVTIRLCNDFTYYINVFVF